MEYFDSKYTGEEVENRLDKVDGIEESIAAIDGRVTETEEKIAENADKIAEVGGKADANENKIGEVDEATKTNAGEIASLGGKVAEVEGKADANATAITEIGGKVTEIEGGITEINGDIEALLESVAAVESKADSNNKNILQLGKRFYVTDFTMTAVRAAAATSTLNAGVRSFYDAIASGKLVYISDSASSGLGMGACVPQTYEKNGIATAVIYDTVDRKWYTLSAARSDRYITVTASDTINLMANEIYTTEFTMQRLIAALGESDGATLSTPTKDFSDALAARKSILIPDANGGGYISLSGSFSNRAVFYVADNKMFLYISVADAGTLNFRRRSFDATAYVDVESAYKLSGNDGQDGGSISEAMGMYKIQYRTTVCPNFGIGGFPPLRVGQVLNLRFIFTAGLGDVSIANNSNWKAVRDRASSTSNDLIPAIVDVTVINPAEGARTVVFYTVKKYS